MRNANSRADLAVRGVEKVRFNAGGKDVDVLGIVEHDLKPQEESFLDTSTGITHKPGELTEARMKELEGQGHFLVTTEDGVKLKDGTTMRKFSSRRVNLKAINFLSTCFRTAKAGTVFTLTSTLSSKR
jgi:hypothetical protein